MTPANQAWLETIAHVLDHGHDLRQEDRAHAPRDATTREVVCHTVRVPMESPVVTLAVRKLGYRFMCAEAASILQGDNRAATITPYAKQVVNFSDDGYTFGGHYGVKYVEQVSWIARQLKRDGCTRQAVMNIWRERPEPSRDLPCTLSLQWLIRDGQLHCVSTMRSSDVWLGLPYDLHTFSAMTAHLALVLKRFHNLEVELGWLHNTAGSRHLYKRDWETALDCLSPANADAFGLAPLDLSQFAGPDDLIAHYWTLVNGTFESRHSWLKEAFPSSSLSTIAPSEGVTFGPREAA
jgi:thymidylate synthase